MTDKPEFTEADGWLIDANGWTPGPWRVAPSRDFSGDIGIACPDGIVAECFSAIRVASERSDEVKANARLIAAAPDLVEALEGYMDCVAFAANPSLANADVLTLKEASDRMSAARDRARAALSRARGEEQ